MTHQQILQSHLDTADRNWLAAHPSAQWRKRHFVPGEDAGACGDDPTNTAVFRRNDGSLVRRCFRAVGV